MSISQNTKIKIGRDSTTVSNKALISMQKESRKCDSIRVRLLEKDDLIFDLVEDNLKNHKDFIDEQKEKEESLKKMFEAQEKLRKFDSKRFGLGFSVGVILSSDFEFKPAFLIGVNYSIFRF